MLLSEIAEMEAFNQLASGNYDNLEEELQAFISVANTAKSLRTKLAVYLAEYNAKIDGQPEARVSVLAKGAENPVQFAPSAAFKTALENVLNAVTNFETAILATNIPTA